MRAFTAAIAAADLDLAATYFAPDARIWHSTDRAWQSVDEMVANARRVLKALPGFQYGNARFTATESGCVVQADLRGGAGPGALDAPVVIVAVIRDGKIVETEEYIDQGHLPRPA
jgi:ketosteroid isomerase-like protein